eukprot:3368974-Amphidinium_carterae.3
MLSMHFCNSKAVRTQRIELRIQARTEQQSTNSTTTKGVAKKIDSQKHFGPPSTSVCPEATLHAEERLFTTGFFVLETLSSLESST